MSGASPDACAFDLLKHHSVPVMQASHTSSAALQCTGGLVSAVTPALMSYAYCLVPCSCPAASDRLAPLYPDQLMVGMEIRDKVATYVRERIGEACACVDCVPASH